MFKLETAPTFDANVKIPLPGGVARTVRATFNFLSQVEYTAAFEATKDLPAPEFVCRLVKDWKTEDDPKEGYEGIAAPYSKAALEEMAAKFPRSMSAFINTYLHEVVGIPLKN